MPVPFSSVTSSGDSDWRLVGVEVHAQVIRAAVFTGDQELLGKMKLSTKLERGVPAVLERIARCVAYALDDCDVRSEQVQAVGVALPADLDSEGNVVAAPDLGWAEVEIRPALERLTGFPVRTGNSFGLATWAIQHLELRQPGGSLAAVFPGGVLGAGLVVDGVMQSLSTYPEKSPLLPPGSGNVVSRAKAGDFYQMRARDIRRAIRKGHRATEMWLRDGVVEAARFAARMVRLTPVSRVALGGGAMDENRGAMLSVFEAALLEALGDEDQLRALAPFISELGDMASLKGAAWVAAGRHGSSGSPSDQPVRAIRTDLQNAT